MSKSETMQIENVQGSSTSSNELLAPDKIIIEEDEIIDVPQFNNVWERIRHEYRAYFAEFLGTLILVAFGDGVVAQKKLSGGAAGSYTNVSMSWGFAVMMGFLVSGGISGGHMNPAVTLVAAAFRGFSWRKVPGYIFSQLLGGLIGAYVVYGTYYQSFDDYEGVGIRTVTGDTATAGIFCTFPAGDYLTTRGQVLSEFVSSVLLEIGIFALSDACNVESAKHWFPIGLFFLIYGIGACFGYQTGYAINMARDFAPRVAATSVGYGREMWTAGNGYAWVPVVMPIIGCFTGAIIYDAFIYQGQDSPLNKPYFGFGRFFGKGRQTKDVENQY
ncbi:hypothetical protein PACTADRAFT_50283 [Pachysolen tannophilus NRRL Y-2460]|uniref:Aquaporin n=1 Tax=Pachysolen tannophilus NRRL Y-2460 TaxID=669874 RepID=A0A1E4TV00_PACTA|nr:hypothetical protein PACTADRAFT_50283 [Pachysolen tannophilus NRRL Y-2460]